MSSVLSEIVRFEQELEKNIAFYIINVINKAQAGFLKKML